MEPSTGLKRQFPNDSEDAHDVNAPGKIPKKGQQAVYLGVCDRRLIDCWLMLNTLKKFLYRQFKMNNEYITFQIIGQFQWLLL